MRRAILDTDILSESIKGRDPIVLSNARTYALEYGQFETTSVSVHEVLFGLAAEVRGRAQQRGRTLELADCLIAVVAHRLALPLVTGNLAHYETIRDAGLPLDLMNWRLVS